MFVSQADLEPEEDDSELEDPNEARRTIAPKTWTQDPSDAEDDHDVRKPKREPTDLQAKYWEAVNFEQKRIKKERPELSGREVLKLAREAKLGRDAPVHKLRFLPSGFYVLTKVLSCF